MEKCSYVYMCSTDQYIYMQGLFQEGGWQRYLSSPPLYELAFPAFNMGLPSALEFWHYRCLAPLKWNPEINTVHVCTCTCSIIVECSFHRVPVVPFVTAPLLVVIEGSPRLCLHRPRSRTRAHVCVHESMGCMHGAWECPAVFLTLFYRSIAYTWLVYAHIHVRVCEKWMWVE